MEIHHASQLGDPPSSPSGNIIYDFGANNGDDIPYYLLKAAQVVAVEANPALCSEMRKRFAAEIQQGRLHIENCVLASQGSPAEVPFYLHKRHHVLGQFPRPDDRVLNDYTIVQLPAKSALAIVRAHGSPLYIKIDIEGHDEVILRELLQNGIRPPYLSAEATSIHVFSLLDALGQYTAFKLVEGAAVAREYGRHTISVDGKPTPYAFPRHSAGPFGNDIHGDWMNADDLFDLLAKRKMGWRDIHATWLVQPHPLSRAQKKRYLTRHPAGSFRAWLNSRSAKNPE